MAVLNRIAAIAVSRPSGHIRSRKFRTNPTEYEMHFCINVEGAQIAQLEECRNLDRAVADSTNTRDAVLCP